MRDNNFYERFAAEWIAAWNSHDMRRILSHYDASLEFSSPILAKLIPGSGGRLKGREAVGAYWTTALTARPDLHFELIAVLKGIDSAVIHYRGIGGKLCAEFFVFGDDALVVESHAHGE